MKYRELMREILISLAGGEIDESLPKRLKSAEEELLKNVPEGIEGRAYLKGAEVLRNLRIELENYLALIKTFRKAMYGGFLAEELYGLPSEEDRVSGASTEERRREYTPLREEVERSLVTFKAPVPKFVGVDMKIYGPFSKGDVAFIPSENAKALMEKGVIEVVEDEGSI